MTTDETTGTSNQDRFTHNGALFELYLNMFGYQFAEKLESDVAHIIEAGAANRMAL